MSQNLEHVQALASQTRTDFEQGHVTDDEIIEAAVAYDSVYWIATHATDMPADEVREVGRNLVRTPLYVPASFPGNCCNIASLVLKKRLEVADVGIARIELIEGGYGEDENALDQTSFYHNYHAFVSIGRTALGPDTIVDITADQFGDKAQSVYVGPIRKPWTRYPRIELWEF